MLVCAAEPFLNGTVTGPALNGTIRGGVAYPEIYNATGVEFSTANVWGTTSDGTSFAVQESGVGTTTRQISRLTVNIGGNYSKLATTFILGDVVGNVTDGTVLIKAYAIW
ncbi:hypothetical protein VNI00_006609 [Paramarasmius palmivorus]|uniref:Uncharacterized protein n=1 Tax=Paramarasmius palmivorus TaxID=297713 RepID=A0AAW0D7A8_9AGAR